MHMPGSRPSAHRLCRKLYHEKGTPKAPTGYSAPCGVSSASTRTRCYPVTTAQGASIGLEHTTAYDSRHPSQNRHPSQALTDGIHHPIQLKEVATIGLREPTRRSIFNEHSTHASPFDTTAA
ncbi:hypothetical protein C8Q70DRAFT_940910 [Cubamyces menziesii]|nr:hypothetical protein C8Q70DRAFT_940910 [Cubamyces menziesii]